MSQQAQTELSAALAAQQIEFKGAIQEFITRARGKSVSEKFLIKQQDRK
ncbi:hypothetical protein [Helicobacter salomonis]|nr:hypothetical protein [Helicobacter salomonis]